ncbi:MAG TPA: hypothetical protein VMV81_14140 [Phycisphaerae bacterium]|nr:hypothetical protein [Phycisphaerae bacterium]
MVVLIRNLLRPFGPAAIIGGLRGRSFLALLGILSLISCAAPRKSTPAVDPKTLSDDAFEAYLATINVVTVDEAYRAMMILMNGEDKSKSFEERKATLEERGVARSAWGLKPENVIDTGSVAYMICRICKISGGIDMVAFGSLGLGDRRYATRELIYRDMIDDMVDYQYMTGARLVGLLGKADAIMAAKKLYPSKGIDLSDQTDRDSEGRLIVPPTTTRPEDEH